jgi:hypothetical protein
MRFKLGLALGFAAGYWAGTTPPDQRRAKLDEALEGVRGNPRLQRVTDTVTRDVRRLGDAVEHRFVQTADSAVGAVAKTVDTETAPGSTAGSTPGSTGTVTTPGSTPAGSTTAPRSQTA